MHPLLQKVNILIMFLSRKFEYNVLHFVSNLFSKGLLTEFMSMLLSTVML